MTDWISVKDKLPNRGVYVLVLYTNGDQSVKYRPHSRGGDYAGDDGKSWYPGGGDIGWSSHWMMLPKPPSYN